MKYSVQNIILSTLVVLLCGFSNTAFGSKLASLTASVSGGIASTEQSFTPYIVFKGDEPLLSTKNVTASDEDVTFILASDFDDINFAAFVEKLIDGEDELLSIGHKIGDIKSEISSLESVWFDGLTFSGKKVSAITLTYSNLKIEVDTENPNKWTNFSYELTLNIFDDNDEDGIDLLANDDNDEDGIDFAYVDYETLEQLEGTTMSKDGSTKGGLKVEKSEDGMFIISGATKETETDTEEVKKVAIKIMYLSTAGAAKSVSDDN